MTPMRTLFLIFIGVALLTACTSTVPIDSGTATSSAAGGHEGTAFYEDPEGRYSLPYPETWRIEGGNILATDDAQYTGTAFIVPEESYAGTSLLDARIHTYVGDSCPVLAGATAVTMEDRTFLHGNWSGAGAGNLYKGEAYTLEENGTCVMVTLYQHLCNLGPDCGPDHSATFTAEESLQNTLTMMAASITVSGLGQTSSIVACTKEAKICPDGSAVGRTGPNCEFAPCPE